MHKPNGRVNPQSKPQNLSKGTLQLVVEGPELLQELEKFKFVLDYKIKELKKQIEPKEEQIADMKDQVKVCLACCFNPVQLLSLSCQSTHTTDAQSDQGTLCCAVLCCAVLC